MLRQYGAHNFALTLAPATESTGTLLVTPEYRGSSNGIIFPWKNRCSHIYQSPLRLDTAVWETKRTAPTKGLKPSVGTGAARRLPMLAHLFGAPFFKGRYRAWRLVRFFHGKMAACGSAGGVVARELPSHRLRAMLNPRTLEKTTVLQTPGFFHGKIDCHVLFARHRQNDLHYTAQRWPRS